jgi:tetratricopeptide (TPR) repeat protein
MRKAVVLGVIALCAAGGSLAMSKLSGQDLLTQARALYATADYEQALAILQKAADAERESSPALRDIHVYRLECLVALDRKEDAERAVERLLVAFPNFRATDVDMPPKAASLFRDTRRRVLPHLVEQQYQAGKTALDDKRYADATSQFNVVLTLLEDLDLARGHNDENVKTLRTLAQEFRDLSIAKSK